MCYRYILNFRKVNVFPRGSRLLLLTRSVLGSITNIITYFTIKHLPLSDVDIINATGAVIACIPSRIFLKVNRVENSSWTFLIYVILVS